MLQIFVVVSVESSCQGVPGVASELNDVGGGCQVHLHVDETCMLSCLDESFVTAVAKVHCFCVCVHLDCLCIAEATPMTELFLNTFQLSLSYILWHNFLIFTAGWTA